jgi:protein O-GlcNAc transferase
MTISGDDSFRQAIASFETGKLNDAERHFKEVLQRQPMHLGALNLLSVLLTRLERYPEAERYIKSALELNSNSDATLYNYGIILKSLKRPNEALERFSQALSLNATVAETWNNRGTIFNDLKQYADAITDFNKAISLQPNYSEAFCNKGNSLAELKRYEEALTAYEKALELKPNLADAWLGRGNVFTGLKRHNDALAAFDKALELKPDLAEACLIRGNIFFELKRYDEALAAYDRALAIKHDLAGAWLGRGNILNERRRYDEAFNAYDKALALEPDLPEAWLGRGNISFVFKRYDDASSAYDKALAIEPNLAEAWLGRGNVFYSLKKHSEAFTAYDKTLSLNSHFAEAWLGRGNVLNEHKHYYEAIAAFDKSLSITPDLAEAWLGRGNAFISLRRYDEAIAAFDRALALKPDLASLEGARLHAKMQLCDWNNFDTECAHLASSLRTGTLATSPFSFLGIPSSLSDQLRCAKLWTETYFPLSAKPVWQRERYRHDRIRIAYLSADFRQHAVSSLLVGMLECHDKSNFDVTAISLVRDDDSEMRRRLQASVERFIVAASYSDDQIVELLKSLEVDILVDLMGFTADSRTNIFARRAVPIQVNYLGYLGTMGADYIDYIIADRIVIPEIQRDLYAEKVVYLPNSFQPTDRQRPKSDKVFTRAEVGLPQEAFVFCCFNTNYKITPNVYDIWMRILKQVDGSVLWLFAESLAAERNFRIEAAARGINAERLIFAPLMPLLEHQARLRMADLFLDTLPYNAGATASDTLWAGLPILTRIGDTFVGKMAASLLNAIGLPELITTTSEAYEQMAIDLATNPEKLGAIKRKLVENRLTTPLFDTELFTKHIEAAYTAMYQRHQAGLAPDHIVIEN